MSERVWGMILLVAGTSIGAGMLAMPLSTAENGLILSIVLMLWVWSVMLASALCLLEVSLSLPTGTNLISMASYTLGPCGRWLVWGLYLGLLYALNAAYMDGLMAILHAGLAQILHWFRFIVGVHVCLVCRDTAYGLFKSMPDVGFDFKLRRFVIRADASHSTRCFIAFRQC